MSDSVLCKWKGALVLMEIKPCEKDGIGKCPECGETSFTLRDNGWAECDCGFAFLYKKVYGTDKT